MPSPRPRCHLVHCPHNQARRVGGHALGAKYTALSMIPGNGVYRVRRRRFPKARSDSTTGGSAIGVMVNMELGMVIPIGFRVVEISSWPTLLCMGTSSSGAGVAWATSRTGAAYSFTGVRAAWAALCEDDTLLGISFTIRGTRISTIRSSTLSRKSSTTSTVSTTIGGTNPRPGPRSVQAHSARGSAQWRVSRLSRRRSEGQE